MKSAVLVLRLLCVAGVGQAQLSAVRLGSSVAYSPSQPGVPTAIGGRFGTRLGGLVATGFNRVSYSPLSAAGQSFSTLPALGVTASQLGTGTVTSLAPRLGFGGLGSPVPTLPALGVTASQLGTGPVSSLVPRLGLGGPARQLGVSSGPGITGLALPSVLGVQRGPSGFSAVTGVGIGSLPGLTALSASGPLAVGGLRSGVTFGGFRSSLGLSPSIVPQLRFPLTASPVFGGRFGTFGLSSGALPAGGVLSQLPTAGYSSINYSPLTGAQHGAVSLSSGATVAATGLPKAALGGQGASRFSSVSYTPLSAQVSTSSRNGI